MLLALVPSQRAAGRELGCSRDELAGATGGSDALLGDLGELLGLDEAWHVGELALAEDLEETL